MRGEIKKGKKELSTGRVMRCGTQDRRKSLVVRWQLKLEREGPSSALLPKATRFCKFLCSKAEELSFKTGSIDVYGEGLMLYSFSEGYE